MSLYDNEMAEGLVPWDVEDCKEVLDWYYSLHDTPKDDWDLNKRGFWLGHEDGTAAKLGFNMFAPMNQLALYMKRRYANDVAKHHLWRLMQMFDFWNRHWSDLQIDGLVHADGNGGHKIEEELLEALCALPYSHTEQRENGFVERKFDYSEVIAKARELADDADPT